MKSNVIKALLACGVCMASVACGSKGGNVEQTAVEEKPKVTTEVVHVEKVDQISVFTGNVEGYAVNNITPQSSRRISRLLVDVGDHVKEGQVVAEMDESSLAQAKSQLATDKAAFERADELYKFGGESKATWEAAKNTYELSLSSYENLLENTTLCSPIAGVVTARNYDNGDMYSGGEPVLVVEQITPVKLYINVSEGYFTKVKKGAPVSVKVDVYGDEEFEGKISLVYPTIDPATRTFPVEIQLVNRDQRVRPGMFARATLNFGTQDHVVVPDLAIVKRAGSGDRYVYVYKDGKVSYNKVELGRRMDTEYELISGVDNNSQVVIAGQSKLADGVEVEVEK